jgi:hypothetical protein
MPDLAQSLHGYDLGHLHIIADLWGIDLEAPDVRQGRRNLARVLLDESLVKEVVEALPREARQALDALTGSGGRLPWSQFAQRFGEVREMGPGRRDRERPYLNPTSTSEILWYRALIARAFFDAEGGAKEFAYIPEDLLSRLPPKTDLTDFPLSRPVPPKDRAHVRKADDRILDQATTLLAAIRMGFDEPEIGEVAEDWDIPPKTLASLLKAAGILDEDGEILAEEARLFLEAQRGEALARLAQAWLNSHEHNDLRLMPHVRAEGEWFNDPAQSRHTVLDLLNQLDGKTWWSLPAFINAMRTHRPDFQRPAGDYDTWYLRDVHTGIYLRGFEHWGAVDGAYLRYLVSGPLHWLGMMDLAAPDKDSPPLAFRCSPWMESLLSGQLPEGFPAENEGLSVDSQGQVLLPPLSPRALRYQIARFCEWAGKKREQYAYRITSASLTRAGEQGLEVKQLLALLRKNASAPLPPNLTQALERWNQHGAQVQFESVMVLRTKHPHVLEKLRASRAARFLGDPLGPTAVVVKAGAWEKVVAALVEMGYLSDIKMEDKY